MSELSDQRPRSEMRASASDQPTVEGIARHGQLKKPTAWRSILKFVAAGLAVLLVSGASVGAIAVNSIWSKRTTVALIGETEGPPPSIGAFEGGFNILIVGTDTRVGQGGIGGTEEEVDSALNDVNILLHVSQDQTNATAISFPRDMVVGIPECPWQDGSGETKGYSTEAINTALYYGGLPCVAETVSELTGLDIQFAGMISFAGVNAMADVIGGVDVCITGPMIDPETGIYLPTAGTYNLKGIEALAFLRSRAGVGDGSDLTRISSQQVYLSSLVRTLKSADTLNDVKKLYSLANAAVGNMTLSNNLADPTTMVSIALALKNIPLERVTFVQYPGSTGGSGIYSGKVQPNREAGDQLMALVKADQPFLLAGAGDGSGSTIDPNAAPVTPDPNATTAPIDNTGLPVLEGVDGQTAADQTCSITQDATGFDD
jgi:LCP family protein required for cell wall assembly